MEIPYEIRVYMASDNTAFQEMLTYCFTRDYQIELAAGQAEDLCQEILRSVHAQIVFLDLLMLNGTPKGFIIYQVDSRKSDWCEREGWGFIRELFVSPDARRSGWGIKLAGHAERKLRSLSVPHIYLTTDNKKDFWTKAGYQDTHEVCAKNDNFIFIK